MTDFLTTIVDAKRQEVAERRRRRPLEALSESDSGVPAGDTRDLIGALSAPGLSAIAEIKRRSPSRGALRLDADAAAIAGAYERGGAAAVSVLTDHEFFGGSDDDLIKTCAATRLPVLRKDFTVDEYQLHETRALGANAVLLIARILADGRLSEWVDLARRLKLAALVEVHDEDDLRHALNAGASVIGVNSRDLRTFRTDLAAGARLRPLIPDGTLAVAESGIRSTDDIATVRRAGFDACLVGEALMTSSDPGKALRELLSPSATSEGTP